MTLDTLIAKLRATHQARGSSFVCDFEEVLADIARLHDPASFAALVPFFEDDAPFEEPMFSIIHTLETFTDTDYVRELLPVTAALWRQAPRWACIIYMRILNSEQARAELIRQLYGAPATVKALLREIMEAVNQRAPQFQERTASVLVAVS